MGGIEPPSNSRPRILLRAQSTNVFLGPRHPRRLTAGWAQLIECRSRPTNMGGTQWLPRRRQTPGRSNSRADGLKVQAAISGSENVVGAILFGTYWFARIVNELSVHSRLASLRSTTTVETDHPLLSFQLPDAQRYRRPSDTSVYARSPRPSRENRRIRAASSPPTFPPCGGSYAPAAGAAPAPGTRRTG